MYLPLRADQRLKQNHEDVLLPGHLQELYLSVKDLGLMLKKIIRQSLTLCQNNWVLFFVMVIYLERKMERSNSGDWKMIFGINLCTLNIGLMKCGSTDPSGQEILYLRALQVPSNAHLTEKESQGHLSTSPTRKKILGKIYDLNNVDCVSSNANSSHKAAMLYMFLKTTKLW